MALLKLPREHLLEFPQRRHTRAPPERPQSVSAPRSPADSHAAVPARGPCCRPRAESLSGRRPPRSSHLPSVNSRLLPQACFIRQGPTGRDPSSSGNATLPSFFNVFPEEMEFQRWWSPSLAHRVVPAAPGLTAGEKETTPGGGVPGSGYFHVSLRPAPCGRGLRPVVPHRAAWGLVRISVSTGQCRRSVLENSHPQMLPLPALLPVWVPMHHRLPVCSLTRSLPCTPCCRPHGTGRDSSSS